jgi:hypothetical protein
MINILLVPAAILFKVRITLILHSSIFLSSLLQDAIAQQLGPAVLDAGRFISSILSWRVGVGTSS